MKRYEDDLLTMKNGRQSLRGGCSTQYAIHTLRHISCFCVHHNTDLSLRPCLACIQLLQESIQGAGGEKKNVLEASAHPPEFPGPGTLARRPDDTVTDTAPSKNMRNALQPTQTEEASVREIHGAPMDVQDPESARTEPG